MDYLFEAADLSKSFAKTTVLEHIDLQIRSRSIVGLLGRNGSGKTTLLRHLMGLYLPTEGSARTLGTPTRNLGHDELVQIGYVPQEIRLLDWMTVAQHLDFVSCFYPAWDRHRQKALLSELELDSNAVAAALSTGDLQKLAIILAVCHHPRLLIFDEPVSDLDPIVRGRLLKFLLEILQDDDATIIVSSHVLRDVEKIVDWVVCLDVGRVVTDSALDDLKERYAEWRVVTRDGDLPSSFDEPFILEQKLERHEARLLVDQLDTNADRFGREHHCDVSSRLLNLEEIFPLLLGRMES